MNIGTSLSLKDEKGYDSLADIGWFLFRFHFINFIIVYKFYKYFKFLIKSHEKFFPQLINKGKKSITLT